MHYVIKWIAWLLVVIGALNWGLFGFFNFNLVQYLLGTGTAAMVIYDLVGISAVVLIVFKVAKLSGMKMKRKKR